MLEAMPAGAEEPARWLLLSAARLASRSKPGVLAARVVPELADVAAVLFATAALGYVWPVVGLHWGKAAAC